MKFDPTTAKPREVEAYLREVILKTFGDKVENASDITSSRGYYNIEIDMGKTKPSIVFINFRKTEAPKIAKAIRSLK